jgi:WD40 repeat protein
MLPNFSRHQLSLWPYLLLLGLLTDGVLGQTETLPKSRGKTSPDGPVLRATAFSADGALALAGDAAGTIQVWDLTRTKLLRQIRCPAQQEWPPACPCYAFSTDGKFALRGCKIGDPLILWNLVTGSKVRVFDTREPVFAVALSPDGKLALASSISKPLVNFDHGHLCLNAVRLWNTSNGKLVRTLLDGYDRGFVPVAFSPDGKLAVAGGGGRFDFTDRKVKGWDLRVWDVATGREKQSLAAVEQGDVTCCAFSPGGKYIAAGNYHTVRVWELPTGKPLWSHEEPDQRWSVLAVTFSPDEKYLMAAGPELDFCVRLPERGADGGVLLFNVATGNKEPRFAGTTDWIRSIAFSPDGKRVLLATGEGIKVREVATGKVLSKLKD